MSKIIDQTEHAWWLHQAFANTASDVLAGPATLGADVIMSVDCLADGSRRITVERKWSEFVREALRRASVDVSHVETWHGMYSVTVESADAQIAEDAILEAIT